MTSPTSVTAMSYPLPVPGRPSWRMRLAGLVRRAVGRPSVPPAQVPRPPSPGSVMVQGPRVAPVAPARRSVPVPIDALTTMLNGYPMARSRMRHLALVEASCLMSPMDPFSQLPPRAMEIAIRQLDVVLPRHPGLHVLRLQLERHLQAHRSRIEAVLAAEDRKWRPEGGHRVEVGFVDSVLGGPWGTTGFMETLPLEPIGEAEAHAHAR